MICCPFYLHPSLVKKILQVSVGEVLRQFEGLRGSSLDQIQQQTGPSIIIRTGPNLMM